MESYAIPREEAEALSWGGLQFTNRWKTVQNKNDIATINSDYKNAKKGTKCN